MNNEEISTIAIRVYYMGPQPADTFFQNFRNIVVSLKLKSYIHCFGVEWNVITTNQNINKYKGTMRYYAYHPQYFPHPVSRLVERVKSQIVADLIKESYMNARINDFKSDANNPITVFKYKTDLIEPGEWEDAI